MKRYFCKTFNAKKDRKITKDAPTKRCNLKNAQIKKIKKMGERELKKEFKNENI